MTEDPWLIDAAGKLPSGLFDLHTTWLGDWEECLAIEPLVNDTRTNISYKPFDTQYCTAVFPIGTKDPSGNYHHDNNYHSRMNGNESRMTKYQQGIHGRLLLSFSAYTNAQRILSTMQPAKTLTSINGIRFINNGATFLPLVFKRFSYQVIVNATFAVDTFFVLSGLLVAYLTLGEMKKRGGARKFNWGMFYFHRFWRLTPPYMLILMFYIPLIKHWGNGPLWPQQGIEVNDCKDTWWTNILYINNLVRTDERCMVWSWYLANDMQFYVISPLMIILLFTSRLCGTICCGAFVLLNFIIAGVISKVHHLPANMVLGDTGGDDYDLLYIKPWCRVGPYAVGIFTGYVLYRTECKVKIPKVWNMFGWAIATAVALAILYGLWTPDLTPKLGEDMSALYNATARTAWGACIAWVIFSCATGHGGPVNALLSWKAIIPLSRLTYCCYLVHPVVMNTYYYSRRTLMHWYDLDLTYLFLGNLCLSYAVAFVVSLAFESPMMGLEKVVLGRGKNS
ncbi:NRF6-like protein [Mya arenaria]|uniref:NRF6-like protein n=1 Tax=Mya arenaria TaxID=6604 RepID=A0ABY7GC37_MYAAR|nr:NRF6-like protein [Mya arenaria]